MTAALATAGACTSDANDPVSSENSELSTLYSYHGRIVVEQRTVGPGNQSVFYAVSPSNQCDITGAIDFIRQGGVLGNPRTACTDFATEKYNSLVNPSDLSACTTYTMGYQDVMCQVGFGANADRWTNSLCDVTVTSSPRTNASGTPQFVVRSIQYQIPGNRSTISYAAGTTNGSTWETKNSSSATVSADWALISSSAKVKLQHDTSTKLSLKQQSTLTETLTFTADTADHNRDVISLWVNPQIRRYDPCSGGTELLQFSVASQPWVSPAFDATQPVMMDFTVGELLNPGTVTDSFRKLFLAQLTQDDIRTRILALNPFIDQTTWTVVANPTLDNDRFRPIQGGACPRNLTDPVTATRSIGCQAKYSETLDTSETFKRDWSVKTKFKIAGISAGAEYSVAYSHTTTASNANDNTADIKLATNTPGICISGQLAVDTMFNVYIVSSFQFACATLQ